MPSNEEDNGRRHRSKVRRVERACDTCRRRKSRCDGSQIEGDTCSTCVENGLECTYLNAAAKRGPKRIHSRSVDPSGTKDYTEQLETRLNQTETRLEDAENLIRQLHAEAGQPRNPQWASLQVLRTALRALASPPPPPTADDLEYAEIAAKFEKLAVRNEAPLHPHYIGQSSGAQLISAAMELKLGCAEEIRWTRRERFWTFKPWEKVAPHTHTYTFPPADLLPALVAAYFTHVNVYLPLLHRPTFEVALARQQHLREDDFAATLLLVCAIGSRWADGAAQGDSEARLACGWEWYDQVPQGQSHLFGQASLYHLQYYSLSVVFLEGSCTPSAHWTLIGMGLRVAQDVGAHRRKQYVEKPSVEAELWKRAFWVLVYLDRAASSSMGRPCAIQYDDFDIDPPIECDDEYWEDPICPFEQPPGVPSKVTFFNYLLKLSHITAFSLRILYSLNKTKVQFGIDDTWEMQFVAELDSALNSWHDELPEHLQWDPARADPVFFDQSVALHCGYYHLQILNHRRFIPMVREAAPTALPSLAICTSAARACTGMVDVQRRRKGNVPVSFNLPAVFTSAIVLLLNVWSGKRTGLIPDPSREIANVHKCMEVVRVCEERCVAIGGSSLGHPSRAGVRRAAAAPEGHK
ncbi:fungal-specific transcription factor domain-containing protein [Mycena sp. CBHHK59/15]|nr:fungal-specific transcription factor domain-containing protein [Mycena sp. CBHHK59/15]